MKEDQENLVSVIMPVYNSGIYLHKAIDSILAQSHGNFELIIIDDASNDETKKILASFTDHRVKVISNEANLGIAKSLNKGIALCNGTYIARMDADDVSIPERFEKQVNFLQKNTKVGVLGGAATLIDNCGSKLGTLTPVKSHEFIASNLALGSCVIHPTVMFNTKVVSKELILYDENYKHAQDYELWLRLISKTLFRNLNIKLINYRIHPAGISQKLKAEQYSSFYKARLQHFPCSSKNDNVIRLLMAKKKKIKLRDLPYLWGGLCVMLSCKEISLRFFMYKSLVYLVKSVR